MITATLMLVSVLLAAEPERLPLVPKEFIDLFEAHEYPLPKEIENTQTQAIHYRLFVPRNLKPNERCPMIVWLHGMGEGGEENHHNLKYLPWVLKDLKDIEQYRFFVLIPQCPNENISWTTPLGVHRESQQTVDMLTITYELLQKTMQDHLIDPDRISLLGICSGGNGGWEMSMRHSEVFSAIGLLAPGSGDSSQLTNLINIPIWCFHNQGDHPEGTQQMVTDIEKLGGNVHLSLLHSGSHDCWTTAFFRYKITDWLLAQKRNALVCWAPPGHQPWKWWHLFGVPLGCVAIVGLGWISERRQRQKKRSIAAQDIHSSQTCV
jgi:predicted peptidase